MSNHLKANDEKGPDHLQLVAKNLNGLLKSKQEALPKEFNETRFLQNCMSVPRL